MPISIKDLEAVVKKQSILETTEFDELCALVDHMLFLAEFQNQWPAEVDAGRVPAKHRKALEALYHSLGWTVDFVYAKNMYYFYKPPHRI